MMKLGAGLILVAATLGGCSTLVPSGPPPIVAVGPAGAELIGQTLRLQTSGGQVSDLHFAGNGVVHAMFGGKQVTGSWVVANEKLCFAWAGASSRECWPYTAPLRRGETVTLTSDRGNMVRVTLQ